MEEELISLKQALRSLVVSSPTTMTVGSLLKDYRNLVGGVLPLSKFGYRDPITFLRERCTDVFVMEGPSWDPILTPKITKNLQHIDQMVQRQKVQSSVKYKGKRRSVPGTNIVAQQSNTTQDNLITQSYNKRIDPLYRTNAKPQVFRETNVVAPIQITEPRMLKKQSHPEPRTIKKETDYTSNQNDYINNQSYNNHELKHQDNKCTTNSNNNKENINTNMEETRPNSSLGNMYKKLPQYTSNSDFPSCDRSSKTSEDSRRQSTSSLGSTSKQARLDELTSEILAIISESGGVWCTDLMTLYKDRYGKELNYNRLGHTSIISLVYSMEDRVAISRPIADGDWFLQEPSLASLSAMSAMTPRAPRPVPAARRAARYVSCRDLAEDREEALPGVEFEPGVYPADCVHYVEGIPAAGTGSLRAGDQLEVMVGEVYSPSHFWLIRVGEEHNVAMEAIMDEMTEYFRGEGASRMLARGAVRVGQYCASEYDRDWHRSLIVALLDCDTVKVRHVDYGTVETVPVAGLKPLPRRWAALPAQAIRARLASARPAAAGRRWPRAACTWLLQRVRDTRLYANVRAVDTEEDIVETFLIDTRGAEDVCLTRELIRVGHADCRQDSALQSGDCYLYPRFSALESGATPNYAEISRYLADGVALDYVDAYRRHVPSVLDRCDPYPHPVGHAESYPQYATAAVDHVESHALRSTASVNHEEPYPRYATASVQHVEAHSRHSTASVSRVQSHPRYTTATVSRADSNLHLDHPRVVTSPPPPPPPAALPSPLELLTRDPLLRVADCTPSSPSEPLTPPSSESEAVIPPPPSFTSPPAPPPTLLARPGSDQSRGVVVQLSEAEWSVLTHLRDADPDAAHWYLMTAAYRALALQPPPPTAPH